MSRASPKKQGLTDRGRHERIVAMARDVEVSENPENFDHAFENVARPPEKPKGSDGG